MKLVIFWYFQIICVAKKHVNRPIKVWHSLIPLFPVIEVRKQGVAKSLQPITCKHGHHYTLFCFPWLQGFQKRKAWFKVMKIIVAKYLRIWTSLAKYVPKFFSYCFSSYLQAFTKTILCLDSIIISVLKVKYNMI